MVRLEGVTFKRGEQQILSAIDWQVERQQHSVIMGLNGSGKTTLLKLITGYEWATSGTIKVLGHRFGQTNIHDLRKRIGWVSSSLDERFVTRYQDDALDVVISGAHATIGLYETIGAEKRNKAYHLLNKLGAEQLSTVPFRYLSQGEKRRVMIARALMSEPCLLILDEPCNGLDVYIREELLNTVAAIMALEGGPTVLYVTHHIEEVLPEISHALLMKDGHVIVHGEKRNVLSDETLSECFRLPVHIDWRKERPWLQIKESK
ncbi:molybdenum ABC transporter ATP-binding protein [Alkalihalobacillus pseudalcaliphilus]|nr:molybdenum ABC transporter ATP-binding protein [Alkalihalobacillus pseudalcaliphilus]